jgi:hypothetical protein
MSDPHFFGYGSLVNTATHIYADAQKATLKGWRRKWVRIGMYDNALLTGVPAKPSDEIQGLIAAVPNADWAALDERELGYRRIPSEGKVAHDRPADTDIAHYAVAKDDWQSGGSQAILLSYLDVVVQGYLQQFGTTGVTAFFDTTDGWDTPVLNDRANPRYPRSQILSGQETALVDQHLDRIAAQIISA